MLLADITSETTKVAALGDSEGGRRRIEMAFELTREVLMEMRWRRGFGMSEDVGEGGMESVMVGERAVGAS